MSGRFGFSCYAQDSNKARKSSFNKVLHSFSLQYNNCIHFPGKFDFHCDPSQGWTPLWGYWNEYALGYEVISKSGFGFGIDLSKGLFGIRAKEQDITSKRSLSIYSFSTARDFLDPLDYDYWAVKMKATYSRILTDRIMLNAAIGFNIPFYLLDYVNFSYRSLTANNIHEYYAHELYLDNKSCICKWMPDFLFGVNFLFHTKRNPRNNFIIGCNANVGFVPRFKGYFSLSEPFDRHDCDISYGSSYIGLNFGYSFIGFDKTFYRRIHRLESEHQTFDFNKAVHAISVQYNNGLAVGGKVIDQTGPIDPIVSKTYSPDVKLKYSCLVRNGFGLSVSLPIGLFRCLESYSLVGVVPYDTVWANGTVGGNYSEDGLFVNDPYAGLILQASYARQIHRNIYMQCDLGISFLPFFYGVDFGMSRIDEETGTIQFTDTMYSAIGNLEELNRNQQVIYAYALGMFHDKTNWIPNLSGDISFVVHGKNPCHNFVFGLNFNVDFTKRVTFDYQTVPTFPEKYKSSGQIFLNMTTIGLHIGYQFMTGKQKKYMAAR